MFSLLRLLHVMVGIWFVAGLAGRTYALREARGGAEIAIVAKLSDLAGKFDRYFAIPGSLAVLVLGLLTAWAGGYPLLGLLQGGHSNWLFASLLLFAATVALVPTVFIPSGKVFERAMRAAVASQQVTRELTEALNDRRVAWAHRAELAAIFTIVVLMVAKPF